MIHYKVGYNECAGGN